MKVERAQLKRVAGLTPGAANAMQTWPERCGLHLELLDNTNHIGWGEASPLPEFSWESLEMAEAELLSWLSRLPRELPDLGAIFIAAAEVASPSARFALETALLDLFGQEQGQPIHQLLGSRPHAAPILLAHLLPTGQSLEQAMAVAGDLYAQGARIFKVKVGGADFAAELALLAALRRRFGSKVGLRLDANGAFSADELPSRLDALAAFEPELIEEPHSSDQAWVDGLTFVSPFPLAFDEGMKEGVLRAALPRLLRQSSYRVLVLKPMLLGGFETCLELARIAMAASGATLVSHLFDGRIALAAAAHLAYALPGRVLACGLARHAGLGIWQELGTPEEPSFVREAEILPPQAPGLWGERRL